MGGLLAGWLWLAVWLPLCVCVCVSRPCCVSRCSPLRACLLVCVLRQNDAQFSHDRVAERRRAELVGTLGNLLSRATAMALLPDQHIVADMAASLESSDHAFLDKVDAAAETVATLYDQLAFQQALGAVVEMLYVRGCVCVSACRVCCGCVDVSPHCPAPAPQV